MLTNMLTDMLTDMLTELLSDVLSDKLTDVMTDVIAWVWWTHFNFSKKPGQIVPWVFLPVGTEISEQHVDIYVHNIHMYVIMTWSIFTSNSCAI